MSQQLRIYQRHPSSEKHEDQAGMFWKEQLHQIRVLEVKGSMPNTYPVYIADDEHGAFN